MALSINHVTLAGNLVRDAEYRTAASGTMVCTFSIAVSKRIKDAAGNWQDEADFFDCVLFGRLGESFRDNNSLIKGTPIALEGRLQLDRWQNKEGENRSKVTVVANTVIPYTRRGGGGNTDFSSGNSMPQSGYSQPAGGYQQGGGFNQPAQNDPYYGGNSGGYNYDQPYSGQQGINTRENITEDDIPF